MNRPRRTLMLKVPGDAGIPDSHMRILAVIRRIPRGKVCTYGRIAELAGLPGRARLVGRILRDSPLAGGVPWHRVVNSAGAISPRPGNSPDRQKIQLEKEGITFRRSGRIDLTRWLWKADRITGIPAG